MSARQSIAARIASRRPIPPPVVPVGESYMVDAPDAREAGRIAWRIALGDGYSPNVLTILRVDPVWPGRWEVIMRTGFQEDDER